MTAPKPSPWYKQFWPWFLIALPLSAVVAGLTTVYIAFKNQDSVVRDDWYQDGKTINQSMERDKRARDLGIAATVLTDEITGEITVRMKGQVQQLPTKLELRISHPTDAQRDQDIMLSRQADGNYHGVLKSALKGRYYLELRTTQWRLTDVWTFPQTQVELRAE